MIHSFNLIRLSVTSDPWGAVNRLICMLNDKIECHCCKWDDVGTPLELRFSGISQCSR